MNKIHAFLKREIRSIIYTIAETNNWEKQQKLPFRFQVGFQDNFFAASEKREASAIHISRAFQKEHPTPPVTPFRAKSGAVN